MDRPLVAEDASVLDLLEYPINSKESYYIVIDPLTGWAMAHKDARGLRGHALFDGRPVSYAAGVTVIRCDLYLEGTLIASRSSVEEPTRPARFG